MIESFANRETEKLWLTGKSKRLPSHILRRALRKLDYIDLATDIEDLRTPPGNRLHMLGGDRKGQYAISINDQWRICFRFEDGQAHDVEVTDCH